ncbi:MAG: hypothetical protein IIZ97_10655 [Prevotella sp.]|nr:hypothetical protein [Prevotella sp.]
MVRCFFITSPETSPETPPFVASYVLLRRKDASPPTHQVTINTHHPTPITQHPSPRW